MIGITERHSIGFNLGNIKDIRDQALKQFIITLDNIGIFLAGFQIILIYQYLRKTDNSIQRSTYFVIHIRQESRLHPVGLFRLLFCQLQLLTIPMAAIRYISQQTTQN